MPGKNKTYTPEFLEEAARIAIETSHAIADVAAELEISETSRGTGCGPRKKHAEDEPPLQLSERVRLRELEREVRKLRMKADLLSKAAAYFAAERENAPALTHMCAWRGVKIPLLRMEVPTGKRHRQAAG